MARSKSHLRIHWYGVDEPQELNFSGSLADVLGELFAFTVNCQLHWGESSFMSPAERLREAPRAAKAAAKVVDQAVKQAQKKSRRATGNIPWFGYDPIHYDLRIAPE